jgi:ribosomal peptide maturation radical SAM protein 1
MIGSITDTEAMRLTTGSHTARPAHSERGAIACNFSVALVCMPFASANRPSLQIGLLAAIAESHGFPTDAHHFNLDLAAALSPALYSRLCEHRGHMTGEWLFAPAAFGTATPDGDKRYFDAFPEELAWIQKLGKTPAYLTELRRHVLPSFIENCLKAVDWTKYSVIGFSSTFQQNVASLALARRIRECHPAVTLVFGGANMEAGMGIETCRAFPFIDYVVSGEADTAFPDLLKYLGSNAGGDIPVGVLMRDSDGTVRGQQAAPVQDLDALPVPKYRPYFERVEQLGLSSHYEQNWRLVFEASRGCWWGQKHHCTFCGLNGLGMRYRAKSPTRVLGELNALARDYRITSFDAVDNILDHRLIPSLFAEIQQDRIDYSFFYEVKANLTRIQLQNLYRGGVRRIQPGIESMSTHVLKLMRKGSTMLQNVRLLKWSRYYGIAVQWNLIWGFPGETERDYEDELAVLKAITHLEPALSCYRIWLERFSPYYQEQERFGVRNVHAEASYRYVYPNDVNLNEIAYFFDYEIPETVPEECHLATENFLAEWQRAWRSGSPATLCYRRIGDGILIDRNGPTGQGTYTLFGTLARIYEGCNETMRSVDQIVNYLRSFPGGEEVNADEVQDVLERFCSAQLMLGSDGEYLSLAVPFNINW